jgi:hypothetical protein
VAELADSQKRFMQGVGKPIRAALIVVETKGILCDDITSEGAPHPLNRNDTVFVFVQRKSFTQEVNSFLNHRFALSNRAFGEPAMLSILDSITNEGFSGADKPTMLCFFARLTLDSEELGESCEDWVRRS